MTEFSKALVERVARAISPNITPLGRPWKLEDLDRRHRQSIEAAATAALTASGLDEALGALEPFAQAWREAEAAADIAPMIETARRKVAADDFSRARTLTDKLKG